MDIRAHNRAAWDQYAEQGNEWTIPVNATQIAAARLGNWQIVLTETKPIPKDWFPSDLHGKDILCLASGGGQQGPILAAAGAHVTVFDNSPKQLQRDRLVAARDGLELITVEGDMRDLTAFSAESFDLIVHPVSNVFIPDVLPVWREAYRVLRPGGDLLAGFMNPVVYIFDGLLVDSGEFVVRYSLPYSDLTSLTEAERQEKFGRDDALEFSHTLSAQIGGQLEAGFAIIGFYEDYRRNLPINQIMPSYIATRSRKPSLNPSGNLFNQALGSTTPFAPDR